MRLIVRPRKTAAQPNLDYLSLIISRLKTLQGRNCDFESFKLANRGRCPPHQQAPEKQFVIRHVSPKLIDPYPSAINFDNAAIAKIGGCMDPLSIIFGVKLALRIRDGFRDTPRLYWRNQ